MSFNFSSESRIYTTTRLIRSDENGPYIILAKTIYRPQPNTTKLTPGEKINVQGPFMDWRGGTSVYTWARSPNFTESWLSPR